jgi:hypothetical protein
MTVRRPPTPRAALTRLRRAFRTQLRMSGTSAKTILDGAKLYDKAYELACMLKLLEDLAGHDPSLYFVLSKGRTVAFRSKGGPIDRAYPSIEVRRRNRLVAEVWTDIEFVALSAHKLLRSIGSPPYGRGHELDIVLVKPGTSGHPLPSDIFIGVEAKHRKFNKALLKELLGVRREMCLLRKSKPNPFVWWNSGRMPTDPPSGLVAYCSSSTIMPYAEAGDYWGIHLQDYYF